MDPTKRQDLLLDAVARVRRRHPNVRCVLVGGGSFSTGSEGLGSTKGHNWRRHLERIVTQLKLERNVVFTGTLPHEELPAAYGAADVFVHAAPWEGFGLVVVEAWTHGRPVVVSKGAGVSELVVDGVNGYTVPPGRSAPIADAVEQLITHRDRAEKIGTMGALSAHRCYVDQAAPRAREIFERTIDLYRRSGLRAGRRFRGWRP
jgi:glycosyltransferase involved in cell wall biosynthesis